MESEEDRADVVVTDLRCGLEFKQDAQVILDLRERCGDSAPHGRCPSRSLAIERTESHRIYERSRRPPSGGSTWTRKGMWRAVRVSGAINTKSAGP